MTIWSMTSDTLTVAELNSSCKSSKRRVWGVPQEDDDLYGFTDGSLGAATHYGATDGATDGDCTGGGAVVVSNRILGLDFLVFGFSFVDEALEAEQPFVLFGTCVVSCCHVDISGIFKMWWMTSRCHWNGINLSRYPNLFLCTVGRICTSILILLY